jgi:hypothetical protein
LSKPPRLLETHFVASHDHAGINDGSNSDAPALKLSHKIANIIDIFVEKKIKITCLKVFLWQSVASFIHVIITNYKNK